MIDVSASRQCSRLAKHHFSSQARSYSESRLHQKSGEPRAETPRFYNKKARPIVNFSPSRPFTP